jgi:hypothetical protein
MRVAQLIVIAILFQSLILAQEPPNAKEDHVAKILDVIKELSRIAAANRYADGAENPDKATREKIYRNVEEVNEPQQLVTLARICWVIRRSESAEDVSYDRIFITAFWHSVRLLSEDTSREAVAALRKLYSLTETQAGYSRWFRDAIAHQKAKIAETKPHKRGGRVLP